MKISVGKYIGEDYIIFEVEGADLKDALEKASQYTDSTKKGNLPSTCGLCNDKNLTLTSYRTREKNFLYVKIRCNKKECGGFSELGLNTKTNVFYWKPFEKFTPNLQARTQSSSEEVAPEDIPF